MHITRIAKIHGNTLLGRDLGGVFEDNTVYGITKIGQDFVIKKLGKSCISSKNVHKISNILMSGAHIFTEEEMNAIKEKEGADHKGESVYYSFDTPEKYNKWKDKQNS